VLAVLKVLEVLRNVLKVLAVPHSARARWRRVTG
jgi:hypothetical protein